MRTRRLSMAAAIVNFLKNQYTSRDGVEHRLINGVFGIFGHGNVTGLGQALEEYGRSDLPHFQPKNEQAMVHTAIAYAKTKKRLGALACTSSIGPGATNMITGAATATVNRLPVLLLPGDIFANRIPAPVLQQLEAPHSQDISVNDCFKPVSKYWDRMNRPEQILTALPEAMRVLADPAETGAVTIAMPEDVQAESYDYPLNFFEKRVYAVERNCCSQNSLRAACDLIKASTKPLIIAGGGVHYSEACQALENFVKKNGIPIVVTQAGKGALLDDNPACLGALGVTGNSAANQAAAQADFILTIGTRLADFTTASKTLFQNTAVRFAGINVNAYDAHKHGALPLVGDARSIIEALSEMLDGYSISSQWRDLNVNAKAIWETQYKEIVYSANKGRKLFQSEVIRILNDHCNENSTVVHAAGGIPGDIHKLWRSRDYNDYHSEYGYSCMGYEIAGALGVKMADPEREVFAFLGDGSYLMLNHEIVTSIQEGLKITIVLNDNHGYQCIHGLQRSCGGKSFGNEFRRRTEENRRLEGEDVDIDFMANAKSLGATVFKAEDESSLLEALKAARKEKRTSLIYIPVDANSNIPGYSWWDVPMSDSSENPNVMEARKAYKEAKSKQRFYF